MNNATPASVTAIYFDQLDESGVDSSSVLNGLASGDKLLIREIGDATNYILVSVTSVVDNTGWFTVNVTVDNSGTLFTNTENCGIVVYNFSESVTSVNTKTGAVTLVEDDLNTGNGTIASAPTTDIGGETERRLSVTGTTGITSLGTAAAGIERILTFTDVLTFTHGASLILPGQNDILTANGDSCHCVSLGGGSWIVVNYSKIIGVTPEIRRTLRFSYLSLTGTTTVDAPVAGTSSKVTFEFAKKRGTITGCQLVTGDARTAGTITAKPTINGTPVAAGGHAIADGTNTSGS